MKGYKKRILRCIEFIYQKPYLLATDKLFHSKSNELGKIPVTAHLLQGRMGRAQRNPFSAFDGFYPKWRMRLSPLSLLRLKFCVMPYE